jgi:uncharacterized LabA/DUF88 family protein
MAQEPADKRVIAFFDGQALFHAAKEAFGYPYPNYDPTALAESIVKARTGWRLEGLYFYTGVYGREDNEFWHDFWAAKLAVMGTRGVHVFQRPLRRRRQSGVDVFEEKGIDVRVALDVVRLARTDALDVALLFTQDQDLSEVADEVRAIARERGRWIKIASAYPMSASRRNRRGVNGTDWIQIDKNTYDACLDPLDYRRHRKSQ